MKHIYIFSIITISELQKSLWSGLVKHLYPAVFRKVRIIYNEDGTSTGKRVFSDGSACALFQRFNTIQEGMAALKGNYSGMLGAH